MPGKKEVEVYRYHLQPGYIFLTSEPTLVSAVVGSCVVVCVYDRRLKSGGMNHFLFPKAGHNDKLTPQYGDVALPALIRMMVSQGSRIKDMEAQIFGGGQRHLDDHSDLGRRNVKTARRILKKKGIPVVSQDVGGVKGRRVVFHTVTNEAIVMKTGEIRQGDWHPYRYRLAAS